MTFFDNFQSDSLIAAHRGFRAHYPENSLCAFKASLGKCHFIELDIQMSKDFVPMIIHDSTLERTTNAKTEGKKRGIQSLKVQDWNLAQLKTLDIGSWFLLADPFGSIASKEVSTEKLVKEMPQTIMTLEDLLLHPSLSTIPLNIEIKENFIEKYSKKVTESVLEVIRRTGSGGRVLISSFNHDYLNIAKNCAPEIPTAALQDHGHPQQLLSYLKALGVAAYHPSNTIVDEGLIRILRSNGIKVNVYTVNSGKRQLELFAMGVSAVFTDYPQLS